MLTMLLTTSFAMGSSSVVDRFCAIIP